MSKDYFKNVNIEWYRQRLFGVMFCVIAVFIILFARLFYLQILKGEEYRRYSENNCIRLHDIDPQRGLIFDRNRNLLVDNRPSFNVGIIVKDAKPLDLTVQRLAGHLNISTDTIYSKIKEKNKKTPAYKPIIVKHDVKRNVLATIEAHKFDLPGVVINILPVRHYINSQVAAHLLGYLGEINQDEIESEKYSDCKVGDYIGKFGVEKEYEEFLKGIRGGRQVEVNVRGQVVNVLKTVEADPGHNLFLTIDVDLQKKAEELLGERAGAIVVIDPSNGFILALVSNPAFDQNSFVSSLSHEEWNALVNNPLRPMQNKAIQGLYPPGSVYKIITAMAGLEEGVSDTNIKYFCSGSFSYGNQDFGCWKKDPGHGSTNIHKAISESCDIYFYQTALKLGVDRLAWYAKAAGLGAQTGINLDREAEGLVPSKSWKLKNRGEPWQGGETIPVAIGQGYNLVTPIQIASLIASVANGGTRYKPLIIKKIETADGQIIYQNSKQVVGILPAGKETLAIIKKGLWAAVNGEHGTARGARIIDFEINGKTGTSQVVNLDKRKGLEPEEIPYNHRHHAWFAGYAPTDKPEIAIAVIIEHGEKSSRAVKLTRNLIMFYKSNKNKNGYEE